MTPSTQFVLNVFDVMPYVVFLGGFPRWQDHPSPGVVLSTFPMHISTLHTWLTPTSKVSPSSI
ncbi:hypothetical protein TorRG33x02_325010 [Trema orientale]|uniref:Uncharacterized protein n=1 Tax=Trema orientale TaxID=63057 RepID=A0A2P5BDG9_TREOI|nr:hypothetical protein TorRG33x02_325010 [Trema orientale]